MKKTIYSVSDISKLTGVSVRTLHHYDEIGLLKPLRNQINGYRLYNKEHLAKLQQIIIYRHLDFKLEEIINLMQSDDFDIQKSLEQQLSFMQTKLAETTTIISLIEDTMSQLTGKKNFDIFFEGLPTDKVEQWQGMIKDSTEEGEFDIVLEHLGKLSEDESRDVNLSFNNWIQKYLVISDKPVRHESIQKLIHEHFNMLDKLLIKLWDSDKDSVMTKEIYLMIADSTVTDPATRDMHEFYKQGLAEHVRDAMIVYAENL